MDRKRLRLILELALTLLALWIVGVLLYRHTPHILTLLKSGSVSDVEDYIQSKGREGWLLLILLQAIETVAIVLPAMPVYICAGAVYGKLQGILMCYLTNLVMNVLLFLAAGRLHTQLAEFPAIHHNPRLERWTRQTAHPQRLVLLMCLLPIIPNGMIPYLSAQTNVSLRGFAGALALGSLPSIVVFVCCGDLLLSEHFHLTLPLVLALGLGAAILLLCKKRVTAWLEPRLDKLLG